MKLAGPLHELPCPTLRPLKPALFDFDKMTLRHQMQCFSKITGIGKLGHA